MKKILSRLFFLFLPLMGGIIVGWLTQGYQDYASFVQPPLSPSSSVFPIVWTILYFLMGVSYLIIDTYPSEETKEAKTIYWIQLALNYLWSFLFFHFDLPLVALVDLIFLIYFVIQMIRSFYQIQKKAGFLQIPYLLWLFFACYLNLGIVLLNS